MSLNSPFLLSPFFLSFFFYLRKCLSHWTEACNKVYSLIYCWGKRILSVSLFLFWIHIIQVFRKGRRKNSWSCTYLWQGLNVHIPFFLWVSGISRIWLNQHLFCWLLSKDSVQRLFMGDSPEFAKLVSIFRQCLSRTKLSFPNFR